MSQLMSDRQVEMDGMSSSFQEEKSWCTYLAEELPRPAQAKALRSRLRRQRLSRFNTLPVTYGEIQEVEEEGACPMDEERAQRTFLQSLETLRRSIQTLHLGRARLSICDSSSLDSEDSDCAP